MVSKEAVYAMIHAGSLRTINMNVLDRAASQGAMRPWTRRCSMRAQAVLASSIRGCDGLSKEDPSKAVVWALRYHVLEPSSDHDDPCQFKSFMGYHPELYVRVNQFLDDLDPYPFHFIQHLSHAAHIIAVHHDFAQVRNFWRDMYESIVVDGFHAGPEPDEVMIRRLRDR